MLIGKKHKILKVLVPLCEAVDANVKSAYDFVKEPDIIRALSNRDSALKVMQALNDVMYKLETRKWKKT